MSGEKPENAGKSRNEKGQWVKGVSGNPKGKKKGTISILHDIKNKLKDVKENRPEEYEELIDYYWKNKRMRELLIKMIDGMPKQSMDMNMDIKQALVEFIGGEGGKDGKGEDKVSEGV